MKLANIISEKMLTRFKAKVELEVEIQINTSKHAEERQAGRGNFKDQRGNTVTDKEIRHAVIKATDKILQFQIDGTLTDRERFVIYDPAQQHLNLVCVFRMASGSPEKIDVITVMKNKDFHSQDRKIKV